jgi:hypothetical protein
MVCDLACLSYGKVTWQNKSGSSGFYANSKRRPN